MHDERVEWYEALILVSLYAVYLAVMYFDKSFQKCAKGGIINRRYIQKNQIQKQKYKNTKKYSHNHTQVA